MLPSRFKKGHEMIIRKLVLYLMPGAWTFPIYAINKLWKKYIKETWQANYKTLFKIL